MTGYIQVLNRSLVIYVGNNSIGQVDSKRMAEHTQVSKISLVMPVENHSHGVITLECMK